MTDRALWDIAEAAVGKNREMQWSLSESVLSRQIAPVFEDCSKGTLTAEQALDVSIDFVAARVANTVDIFHTLFDTLDSRINSDDRLTGHPLPSLDRLKEFFMGLSGVDEWATNQNITRKELYPLFVRVAVGKVSRNDGQRVFCQAIQAKGDYYMELVHTMIVGLAEEISVAVSDQQTVTEDRVVSDDD